MGFIFNTVLPLFGVNKTEGIYNVRRIIITATVSILVLLYVFGVIPEDIMEKAVEIIIDIE